MKILEALQLKSKLFFVFVSITIGLILLGLLETISTQDMKKRIEHFVTLLKFDKKIVFQNENLSTLEAKELTKGEIKHKRDGRLDSKAAKIILERYLSK